MAQIQQSVKKSNTLRQNAVQVQFNFTQWVSVISEWEQKELIHIFAKLEELEMTEVVKYGVMHLEIFYSKQYSNTHKEDEGAMHLTRKSLPGESCNEVETGPKPTL